jgi:DNA-directed RNA polymerase specialized sigma24 family protein
LEALAYDSSWRGGEMNARMWWWGCDDEDDVKWYRRHIIKKPEIVQWISDQQGRVVEDPLELMIRAEEEATEESKELDTDIIGVLFKGVSELDQKILRLRHEECLKWQDISDKLGYNLSYLWKREKRAMEKIRAIIKRDNISPWRKDEEE